MHPVHTFLPYLPKILKRRALRRPRCRWEDNIKMDPEGKNHSEDLDVDGENIIAVLRKIRWEGMDWMHLAEDKGPVVGSCEQGLVCKYMNSTLTNDN
jgi:hypothetical protein